LGKKVFNEMIPILIFGTPLFMTVALKPELLPKYLSVYFFASLAFLARLLSLISNVLRGESKARPFAHYSPLQYLILLTVLGYGGGLLVAVGGGLIRRSLEWGLFDVLRAAGYQPAVGYQAIPSIFDEPDSQLWVSICIGWLIGLVVGIWATRDTNLVVDPRALQRTSGQLQTFRSDGDFAQPNHALAKKLAPLDGFGMGVFAVYGMDAALKAINALPIASIDGRPLDRVWPLFIFSLLVIPAYSALTAAGGGLLAKLVVSVGILGTMRTRDVFIDFFFSIYAQIAGCLGVLSAFVYWHIESQRRAKAFWVDIFFPDPAQALFVVMLGAGIVGLFLWTVNVDYGPEEQPG
jgi:hypothetical protein